MMNPRAFLQKPLPGRSSCRNQNLIEELILVEKGARTERGTGIGKERGTETERSPEIGIGAGILTENVRETMQTETKSRIELIDRRIEARNQVRFWIWLFHALWDKRIYMDFKLNNNICNNNCRRAFGETKTPLIARYWFIYFSLIFG